MRKEPLEETGNTRGNRQRRSFRRPSAGGVLTPRLEPLPIASKDQEVCLGQCPHHKDCHLYFLLRASPLLSPHGPDITCYDFCKFFKSASFWVQKSGGSPQPFRTGQDMECGYSGFSLIDSQLGVLVVEEVTWVMEMKTRGLEESSKDFRIALIRERAWSAQLTARQGCSATAFRQDKICDFCFPPPPILLEWLRWKQAIAFSVTVTRQQAIFYPFEGSYTKNSQWECAWLSTVD